MNKLGEITPRVGCRQRNRASTPTGSELLTRISPLSEHLECSQFAAPAGQIIERLEEGKFRAAASEPTLLEERLNRDMGPFKHLDAIRQERQTFQREMRALKLSATESKGEMNNEHLTEYDRRLTN